MLNWPRLWVRKRNQAEFCSFSAQQGFESILDSLLSAPLQVFFVLCVCSHHTIVKDGKDEKQRGCRDCESLKNREEKQELVPYLSYPGRVTFP